MYGMIRDYLRFSESLKVLRPRCVTECREYLSQFQCPEIDAASDDQVYAGLVLAADRYKKSIGIT